MQLPLAWLFEVAKTCGAACRIGQRIEVRRLLRSPALQTLPVAAALLLLLLAQIEAEVREFWHQLEDGTNTRQRWVGRGGRAGRV